MLLDGVRTLRQVFPDYKDHFYVDWTTLHDDSKYVITFQTIPPDYPSLSASLTAMIDSWHWNSGASLVPGTRSWPW